MSQRIINRARHARQLDPLPRERTDIISPFSQARHGTFPDTRSLNRKVRPSLVNGHRQATPSCPHGVKSGLAAAARAASALPPTPDIGALVADVA